MITLDAIRLTACELATANIMIPNECKPGTMENPRHCVEYVIIIEWIDILS